jgi:hypothetical protein
MKYLIWIIIAIFTFLLIAKVTNFWERDRAYNKHMCAVYGYEEDCKTPLPPERRLK